jgi:hypothetical protein
LDGPTFVENSQNDIHDEDRHEEQNPELRESIRKGLGLSLELTTNRRGKDFRRGRWMNWVASPVATPGFKLKYRVTAGNWFMLTDKVKTSLVSGSNFLEEIPDGPLHPGPVTFTSRAKHSRAHHVHGLYIRHQDVLRHGRRIGRLFIPTGHECE